MKKLTIFTDGGARGNPGPAGAGAALVGEGGETLEEISKPLGVLTNNAAEYEAVVLGLQAAKRRFGKGVRDMDIEVKLDSKLIAEQLSYRYQIKEKTLVPLFIKVHNMRVASFPNLTFTHVPRAENKHADRLANEAMDRAGDARLF